MWGIARTPILSQYYCLRGILGIGRYLEAVRRKILWVIRQFLIILTIKKEKINARRNKSHSFPSLFQNFIFHNSDSACVAEECIFSNIVEFIEKILWECLQTACIRICKYNLLRRGQWILSSGLINYLKISTWWFHYISICIEQQIIT